MNKDEETPEIIDLTTLDTKDTKVLSKEPNQLSVPLTDAEKIEVGRVLGEHLVEHERLEEIEKSRSSAARAQKKSRELEHARLGKISATGCEDRQVDVLCIAVLSSNRRVRVREDTGAVLHSRALTGPERDELLQQPLPLPTDGTDSPEPVTIEGVEFSNPAAAVAFINNASEEAMRGAGLEGRTIWYIKDGRPHASLQALADVVGIDKEAFEAIRKAAELPPEPKPRPKGARDLVKAIAAGEADAYLDDLDADNRSTVEKAIKARRDALTDAEFAEAEKPKKSL